MKLLALCLAGFGLVAAPKVQAASLPSVVHVDEVDVTVSTHHHYYHHYRHWHSVRHVYYRHGHRYVTYRRAYY